MEKIRKKEKRKIQRRKCFVPVEGKKGTLLESSQTIDISKSGIGFISAQPITPQKKIPVAIALTPDSDPIIVMGQIQWVRRIPGSKHYRVGMTFKNILSGSKFDLERIFFK